MKIGITNHALARLDERGITLAEVYTAAERGSVVKQEQNILIVRHRRISLVLSRDLTLITAYREPSIKKKLKVRRQERTRHRIERRHTACY